MAPFIPVSSLCFGGLYYKKSWLSKYIIYHHLENWLLVTFYTERASFHVMTLCLTLQCIPFNLWYLAIALDRQKSRLVGFLRNGCDETTCTLGSSKIYFTFSCTIHSELMLVITVWWFGFILCFSPFFNHRTIGTLLPKLSRVHWASSRYNLQIRRR